MATSTVKTRQAEEKLRNIALIGKVSHQIVGAKLPSNRQMFEVFFYNMRFVKLDAKSSADLTIDAALIFWAQARIPTRRKDKCVDLLLRMYEEWKKLQKHKVVTMAAAMKQKYDKFMSNLDNLFDISHADAMQMMTNDEDKEFLEKQRMDGRPGSMLGIDQKLAAKEKRSQLRKEEEEARKSKHLEASKKQQSGKYTVQINLICTKKFHEINEISSLSCS